MMVLVLAFLLLECVLAALPRAALILEASTTGNPVTLSGPFTVTDSCENYNLGVQSGWELPSPGQGAITFQAYGVSGHDIIIGLFPTSFAADVGPPNNNFIDVVIGGWLNTQNAVRNGAQGTIWNSQTGAAFTGISPTWDNYTVAVGDGKLTVSYKGQVRYTWAPTCSTKQLPLLNSVKYFSFSSCGNTAYYRPIPVPPPTIYTTTDACENYRLGVLSDWVLPSIGQGTIKFQAYGASGHDIIVGLFATSFAANGGPPNNNFVDVVIGGWSNTQNAVRNGAQGAIWATQNGAAFTGISPTWDDYTLVVGGGRLTVSYKGQVRYTWAPTVSAQVSLLNSVKYFSLSSCANTAYYRSIVVS